jgi:hypothetical protein
LRQIVLGEDGKPSISNTVLFIGLGLPLVVWAVTLVLVSLGKLEWITIAGAMEWVKDFVVVVILPYVGKKISGMFKAGGVAPEGFGGS